MGEISHQIKYVAGEMKRQFKEFTQSPPIQEAIQNTKKVAEDAKETMTQDSPTSGERKGINRKDAKKKRMR